LAAARLNVPVVFEPHKLPPPRSRNATALAALVSHPHLRRIASISLGLLHDLEELYGPPHPGASTMVAHDAAHAGNEPTPPPVNKRMKVGYFGHLYPGKGMETIAALAPELPDYDFDVFGGLDADVARWQTECRSIQNLTIHGHIPHDEVRAKAELCDVLLAPYGSQVRDISGRDIANWMSPLKIFEYMAAGRAIVTADLPVLREVLVDGETALLCQAGDLASWTDALVALDADPELRQRLGSNARRTLVQRYTWDQRAVEVLKDLP
jgi:glycosyltransferase involved in cell wall biosynthesis